MDAYDQGIGGQVGRFSSNPRVKDVKKGAMENHVAEEGVAWRGEKGGGITALAHILQHKNQLCFIHGEEDQVKSPELPREEGSCGPPVVPARALLYMLRCAEEVATRREPPPPHPLPSPACPLLAVFFLRLVRGVDDGRTEAALQEMEDAQMRVPSQHARSRLRWTRQLHGRFVEAVSLLGGANEATPKSVKKAMGIPGLTLYHLKSHLQKYRLAMKRNPEASCEYKEEADCRAEKSQSAHNSMARDQYHTNENMEVQSKLDEQIEVQRHLQLRIEAQGRYMQSALRRAQEMLSSCSMGSAAMEAAESGLSELVSVVDAECLSSSCSGGNPARPRRANYSGDSCLTSWEGPQVEADKQWKHEAGLLHRSSSEDADDTRSDAGKPVDSLVGCDSGVGNRGRSILCEENCDQGLLPGCSSNGESPQRKSCYRAAGEIDLNREPMLPTSLMSHS